MAQIPLDDYLDRVETCVELLDYVVSHVRGSIPVQLHTVRTLLGEIAEDLAVGAPTRRKAAARKRRKAAEMADAVQLPLEW